MKRRQMMKANHWHKKWLKSKNPQKRMRSYKNMERLAGRN